MRILIIFAALTGLVAVALGAFGAHGLEGRLSEKAADWWETATFYALPHAIAALAIALSGQIKLALAGWAFVIGATIFAGSLYAMTLLSLAGAAAPWLGAITPVGGLSMLTGWGLIVVHGLNRQ